MDLTRKQFDVLEALATTTFIIQNGDGLCYFILENLS